MPNPVPYPIRVVPFHCARPCTGEEKSPPAMIVLSEKVRARHIPFKLANAGSHVPVASVYHAKLVRGFPPALVKSPPT